MAAERIGQEFGGTTARQVVAGQRVVLARERGDLAASPQFVAHLDEHRPEDGRIPVWSLAVAWLHADCGLVAGAVDRLRPIAERTDDFRAFRADPTASSPWRLPPRRSSGSNRPGARPNAIVAPPAESPRCSAPTPTARCCSAGRYAHFGPTRRYVGLATVAGGDVDRGLSELHRALCLSASKPLRARTLVDIASVLEGVQPAAARRALDEGHRLAEEIGMQALATA